MAGPLWLVTILINLALFPLKLKSIRSSQAMQRVAPQIKAIQERYKGYKFNDPRKQRMNQEVMALYKQHGVNPFGGCLPMVVQIPFLFGFYRVLDLAIELRQAPFVGWIHDLSARDPFFILPVTMIVTMFLLQKMTPTPATDPAPATHDEADAHLFRHLLFYVPRRPGALLAGREPGRHRPAGIDKPPFKDTCPGACG